MSYSHSQPGAAQNSTGFSNRLPPLSSTPADASHFQKLAQKKRDPTHTLPKQPGLEFGCLSGCFVLASATPAPEPASAHTHTHQNFRQLTPPLFSRFSLSNRQKFHKHSPDHFLFLQQNILSPTPHLHAFDYLPRTIRGAHRLPPSDPSPSFLLLPLDYQYERAAVSSAVSLPSSARNRPTLTPAIP